MYKLSQEIPLATLPPSSSPPNSASFPGAAEDQSRRQNLLQSKGFPWEPQQIFRKRRSSIHFHGEGKGIAPEHQMVLVFHWSAERKSFQIKPCLWPAAGVRESVLSTQYYCTKKPNNRERSSLWKPLLPLWGGECIVNMLNFFFLPIPIISLHSPSHLQP